MRVLVLGATGYLGSVVTETLVDSGHDVIAMVRSPRTVPNVSVQRVADLSDADAVSAAVGADVDAGDAPGGLGDHALAGVAPWERRGGGELGQGREHEGHRLVGVVEGEAADGGGGPDAERHRVDQDVPPPVGGVSARHGSP